MRALWTASIVSHGHGITVRHALVDIHTQLAAVPHRIVLTLNAGEDAAFVQALPRSLRNVLDIMHNPAPKGFGANHNAALLNADSEFVLVADPDLALPEPVFDTIESALAHPGSGIVAPLAHTPAGHPEDNGRPLPTALRLLRRKLHGRGFEQCRAGLGAVDVDWLAGLFLAMRGETFRRLGGFDERYYLYCEDVDLCLRARAQGLRARLLTDVRIIHAARRDSARRVRHLYWHTASLLRLWRSPEWRLARDAYAATQKS